MLAMVSPMLTMYLPEGVDHVPEDVGHSVPYVDHVPEGVDHVPECVGHGVPYVDHADHEEGDAQDGVHYGRHLHKHTLGFFLFLIL